jgi:hypothetical protein
VPLSSESPKNYTSPKNAAKNAIPKALAVPKICDNSIPQDDLPGISFANRYSSSF